MSEERKFFKNMASMALSMVFPNLLNLVLTMIVARVLLKAGLDDYNTIITYPAMFAIMSDFGLSSVLVRDVSRQRGSMDRYFGSFFTLRIGTSLLMAAVSLVLLQFMQYQPYVKDLIYLAIASQFIFQMTQVFSASFQAAERMEFVTYGILLQAVSFFGLSVYFLGLGLSIRGLVYAGIVSNAIMLAAYAYLARGRITRVRPGFDGRLVRYMAMAALPFGAYAVFNTLSVYFDKFLISVLRNGELSNYTQPGTMVMALSFISTAYVVSVFPLFSKISAGGGDSVRYACEKSLKYLFALMLPICVGTTLLADRIIYTLWPTLPGAIPVLRILIWTLLIAAMNAVGSTLLNASHRERANTINLALCVILSAALNFLLIPTYGAVGSAVVCVLTLGTYMALTLYLIRNDIRGIRILDPFVRIAIASLAMAAVVLLLPLNNLFVYVALGAVTYFAAFALVGGVTRDDIALVKKILFGGAPEDQALPAPP